MPTEADTCRTDVVPRLQAAGWDDDPHSIAEQRTITDERIVPVGKGFIRKAPKRVDYLLRYTRDFPLAVVEAKAAYRSALDGLQQAKQYAEMLGLKFAYATNGKEIVEFDYFSGRETVCSTYPRHLSTGGDRTTLPPGAGAPSVATRVSGSRWRISSRGGLVRLPSPRRRGATHRHRRGRPCGIGVR
jgi:hypothetical protein